MKKLFILGLLIKILLIFTAFHSDLIYTYEIPSHFFKNLNQLGTYYGPLSYITFALLSPLYFLSAHVGFWILKIPYLLVDISVLYVLLKISKNVIHKKILIFWWLNPIVIFSTYALGQLEIILCLCVVLSIYSAFRNKILSMVFLGVGVAYKSMTLPLLIPSALILEKSPKKRILIMLAGLLIPIFLAALFWFPTRSGITNNYFPTGIIFFPKPELSFSTIWEYLAFGIGVVGFIATQILLFKYKKNTADFINMLFASLGFIIVALPIYSIHRYMVLMPLLILFSLNNKKEKFLALILVTLTLGYIYVWRLQWGLFVHIYPQATNLPALREFVSPIINYENAAFLFKVTADSLILYLAAASLSLTFKKLPIPRNIREKLS